MGDFMARAGEARAELSTWLAEGKIIYRVDVQRGLENAPKTLRRLFTGENQGKQLLHLASAIARPLAWMVGAGNAEAGRPVVARRSSRFRRATTPWLREIDRDRALEG